MAVLVDLTESEEEMVSELGQKLANSPVRKKRRSKDGRKSSPDLSKRADVGKSIAGKKTNKQPAKTIKKNV